MKIQIINPNTNKSVTTEMEKSIYSNIDTQAKLTFVTAENGPDTIESVFDECLAATAVLDCIQRGANAGYAAHVIGCFGDPGLDAARELVTTPVIGIAEASMHVATLIATKFSIVTTVTRIKTHTEQLVYKYGYERKCNNIRAINSPVASLLGEACVSKKMVESECQEALEHDNIGAIILGCAAMSGLALELSRSLKIPVIDGVSAGIHIAEALVRSKITTSKHGDYALPSPKQYRGTYSKWNASDNG